MKKAYRHGDVALVKIDKLPYGLISSNTNIILQQGSGGNPLKIDEQNRFHSITQPAIRWKGGKEFYFINGVSFEKSLWEKVVKDSLTPQEVFAIENTEQRRIAYELMDKTKMRDLKDYKILDEVTDDGKSYGMKIVSFNVDGFNEPFIYLNCFCPTTGREYFIQTKNTTCWEAKNNSFGLENVEWINEW